jgi:putative copper resistance protein D
LISVDAALIFGRWITLGAATIISGGALFRLYGLPPSYASAHETWLRRLIQVAAAIVITGIFLLLVGESVEMTGAFGDGVQPNALWGVATDTYFGAVWCVQLVLALAVTLLSLNQLNRIWLALAGAALVSSFAWMGHGGEGGALHQWADVVHLLAAAAWLGALAPLFILALRASPYAHRSEAEALLFGMQRFSTIGPIVVAALVLTGLINAWFLIGPTHLMSALSSAYGVLLAAKLVLLAAMLGLAALHRFALTPSLKRELTTDGSIGALSPRLRWSLAIEAALGLLVLGAAAWLGATSPPAMGN